MRYFYQTSIMQHIKIIADDYWRAKANRSGTKPLVQKNGHSTRRVSCHPRTKNQTLYSVEVYSMDGMPLGGESKQEAGTKEYCSSEQKPSDFASSNSPREQQRTIKKTTTRNSARKIWSIRRDRDLITLGRSTYTTTIAVLLALLLHENSWRTRRHLIKW